MEYLRGPPEDSIVIVVPLVLLWYSPLTWGVHAVKCGHQTIVLKTLLITLLQ